MQHGNETEVRHDRIPRARRPHGRRCRCSATTSNKRVSAISSHDEQERRDAGRGEHEHHAETEQRKHRLKCSRRDGTFGVADPVHRAEHHDDPGRRYEPTAERVEMQVQPGQRDNLPPRDVDAMAGQRGDPDAYERRAHERARAPSEDDAGTFPQYDRADGRDDCEDRSRRKQRLRRAHRPVRRRSASMIACGSGGQPGISRSTSSTSATAPSTPWPPRNTPQFFAQSPSAMTSFGAGVAS